MAKATEKQHSKEITNCLQAFHCHSAEIGANNPRTRILLVASCLAKCESKNEIPDT